jgi:hypothetical protein
MKESILIWKDFLKLAKILKKPFLFMLMKLLHKVVGTSFKIKAYADQPNIEV